MKYFVLALLVVLTLSSYAASAAPKNGTHAQSAELSTFPGATEIEVVPDNRYQRTLFQADAPIEKIYDHYDAEITSQGWRCAERERDDDSVKIEAAYVRQGQELGLEIERRNDGRYELKTYVERENDDYDSCSDSDD